jgi:hypothetical protein
VPQDPCQLQIHHADLDHSNGAPNNLRTLCANCHVLIHQRVRIMQAPTKEQRAILAEFDELRKRRLAFVQTSREFHDRVAADFRSLVQRGREAGLEVRAMCRRAGLSHEMGYRLIRGERDRSDEAA